jgi:hypothetical protein
MSTLVELGFLLNAVLLLATSLLLLYPLVTHAQNVAYTEGVVLLSLSLFVFTASYALGVLGLWTLAGRAGLNLVATVLLTAGVWQFAQEFVTLGDSPGTAVSGLAGDSFERDSPSGEDAFTEGFDDADDD